MGLVKLATQRSFEGPSGMFGGFFLKCFVFVLQMTKGLSSKLCASARRSWGCQTVSAAAQDVVVSASELGGTFCSLS